MDLRFFLNIRREHFPPYYRIPGIHPEPSTPVYQPKSTNVVTNKDLLTMGICDDSMVGDESIRVDESEVTPQMYVRSSSPAFGDLIEEGWLEDDEEGESDQYVCPIVLLCRIVPY
jgi:hypothetical protein